jgi:cysteine desulfurase/selenocysteine lyase
VSESDVIYLDHAGTSFPKAPEVAEAAATFLNYSAGNPGRGGHRLSVAASRVVEGAREDVAALLGGDPERTFFGPGATFWLNTVIASRLGVGARVVTTALEHNAVMRPLRWFEKTRRIKIAVVEGAHPSGVPTAEEVARRVREAPTDLVVMTHASNVSGAVLPVAEVAAAVAPVPVLLDAAQTAGSLPIDFEALGVAALACSGHKGLLGPPGIGMLLLAPWFEVEPLVRGGTGSRSESEEMPDSLPDRFEAGTVNSTGAAGLGAACRWLRERTVEAVHDHQQKLVTRIAKAFSTITDVEIHGRNEHAPHIGILSFSLKSRDTGEVAAWLDRERGIMVRVGLHCAPAAHRRLGTFPGGTLRAGIGPFNTDNDVDALVAAIRDAAHGKMQS